MNKTERIQLAKFPERLRFVGQVSRDIINSVARDKKGKSRKDYGEYGPEVLGMY